MAKKTRWKYRIVVLRVNDDRDSNQRALDRNGEEGWELVTAIEKDGYIRCLFKQPY